MSRAYVFTSAFVALSCAIWLVWISAAFDRAYMTGQVQAHQQTLTELQSYQGMVQTPALRAMIEKAIPAVQQHLERAQRIQGQLGS